MLKELSKNDKEWRNLAYAICRDKSLADDLTQEMYLKFHRNPKKNIDARCVYFTLKNLFRDYLRKQKRNITIPFEDYMSNIEDESGSLEMRKFINEKLNKLPFVYKEVLLLTSEYSLRECEELMANLSLGKISYQWFHHKRKEGLHKLKTIINERI